MTDDQRDCGPVDWRVEIEPEPTAEEMAAILEVIRLLHDKADEGKDQGAQFESSWTRTARREGLRPLQWMLPVGGWGGHF